MTDPLLRSAPTAPEAGFVRREPIVPSSVTNPWLESAPAPTAGACRDLGVPAGSARPYGGGASRKCRQLKIPRSGESNPNFSHQRTIDYKLAPSVT